MSFLREKAYDLFTSHLLARDITPGQIVSQRELVELTGMSLGAIREMIPRLEADGLVRTVPNRGILVAQVDLELVHNAFQLRLILEREAVAHFATTASGEEIERMRAEFSAVREEALKNLTPELLSRAQQMDWAMHDTMIDGLGNELVSNIYRVNQIKIRLIRHADTRLLPELLVSVMNEHLAILDALGARDVDAAVRAMQTHIQSAKRRALQI